MSTLLYNSATDNKVERDYLANLQTPAPMGSRHAPYPFYNFATDTVNAIENAGFTIEQEDYAITKDENRMFGLLNVSRPQDSTLKTTSYIGESDSSFGVPVPVADLHKPDWNMLVALRGSHDQSISRGLAIGSRVMVCSNLCFHGDLGIWNSKQTTNIAHRIPEMVRDAVSGLGHAGQRLKVDFDRFNDTKITRDQGDNVLLDIFRSGGFSPSQLGRAVTDWDKCSVEEHTANGRNIWWLFNSATHALKPTGANINHADVQHRSTIVYNKVANAGQLLAA
jgi:hypothetical protein